MRGGKTWPCLVAAMVVCLPSAHASELGTVEERLRGARDAAVEAEQQAGSLLEEVERLDRDIEERQRQLADLRHEAREAEAAEAEAKARVSRLDERLAGLEARLRERLAAVYRLRRRGLGPVLLGDPATLDRRLGWFGAIVDHDRELVREVASVRREAEAAAAAAAEAASALAGARRDEERGLARLEEDRARKQSRLAALRDEGARQEELVRELGAAARRLRELVRPSGEAPLEPGPDGWRPPLGSRRGRVVAARNGVEIPSEAGAEIHAAAAGRVVFADWFPGYGKMIIVDHGGHVHSIYGYAADLTVARGLRVEPGEVIGHVGSTGVARDARLYFEIRERGTARDPWARIPALAVGEP